MSELETISNIAANWWAEAISNPKMDSGSDELISLKINYMASNFVKKITENQKNNFKNKLFDFIYSELEKRKHGIFKSRLYTISRFRSCC